MMPAYCPHESAVTRAARSSALPEELRLHAATCDICQDALRLQEGLLSLAATTRPLHRLPSAEDIWRKAEVIRKLTATQEAAMQAARPVLWSQSAALLAAALILLFSFGGRMLAWLGHLAGSLAPAVAHPPNLSLLVSGLGLTPIAVLAALVLLLRRA